eukprot:1150494-Pelagomonas_calceolata.AAC.6
MSNQHPPWVTDGVSASSSMSLMATGCNKLQAQLVMSDMLFGVDKPRHKSSGTELYYGPFGTWKWPNLPMLAVGRGVGHPIGGHPGVVAGAREDAGHRVEACKEMRK